MIRQHGLQNILKFDAPLRRFAALISSWYNQETDPAVCVLGTFSFVHVNGKRFLNFMPFWGLDVLGAWSSSG